ncbi:MAG: hypothetical protein AAGD92_03105 [Pseudomonadota bacterium]
MKKTLVISLCTAASLTAGAAFAGHHEEKKGDYAEKAAQELEAKFAKADGDGNGAISGEEFMAAKMAEAEKEWAKWLEGDANGDGAMSLDEAKAVQAKHMAMKKEKMKEKRAQ